MATSTVSIPDAAAEVVDWIKSGDADESGLKVVDARVVPDDDAEGEPILRFIVALEAPEDETWPLDSVLAFHRAVGERAAAAHLGVASHVMLKTAGGDEIDAADKPFVVQVE